MPKSLTSVVRSQELGDIDAVANGLGEDDRGESIIAVVTKMCYAI